MAVQLPNFQRIGFEEANPFLKGMATGQQLLKGGVESAYLPQEKQQALQKAIYENMVSKATVPYAGPMAYLTARHLEQENKALPLQYILQYSKDPVAVLTALLSGHAGELGNNLANQMLNVSNAATGLSSPAGYNAEADQMGGNIPQYARNNNAPSRPIAPAKEAENNPIYAPAPADNRNVLMKLQDWMRSFRPENKEKQTVYEKQHPARTRIERTGGPPTEKDFKENADANGMSVEELKKMLGYS